MNRVADHPIHPLFLSRWSPRAMSGAPLPRAEILRLLEAARWAPSSGNQQPWRFVVADRDTPAFQALMDTLDPFNQAWCVRASAFLVVCTETVRTTSDGQQRPRRLAAFDAGAAWMSIALQGHTMGLVVHALEGFDHDKARAVVRAPADIDVLVVVAVGLPGDPALLPEKNRAGEHPNLRFPIDTRVVDGHF